MTNSFPLFATIDLGSNSFHLLIVQHDPKEPDLSKAKIVTRIKRKVRLASGLNKDGILSVAAINRGLDCIQWFADTLNEYRPEHCTIVATATLRLAKNSQEFVQQGEKILQRKIQVISGEQEASFIYQGASSTSGIDEKQLVIDIGGASTEIIIGKATSPIALTSLNMGCVTWLENFFVDKKITQQGFELAIKAAKKELGSIKTSFIAEGWQACFGASGTIQTISEILFAEQKTSRAKQQINLNLLNELKKRAIDCGHIDNLSIQGLIPERAIVFPSGLAILIAIFEELNVSSLQLSKGALREGLLFSLVNSANNSINDSPL